MSVNAPVSRRHLMQSSLLSLLATSLPSSAQDQAVATPSKPEASGEELPYVQTPAHVVRRMLQLADTRPTDTVWDLGSGDGRIVIAAARDFGARGAGYEIDPELIRESVFRARRAGVATRTRFLERDLFTLAFTEPTVVTLYLLPEFNARLRPHLFTQMRPGARIVSHEWDMGDWRADETLLIPSPAKPHGLAKEHKVMLWVVPAQIGGRWRVTLRHDKLMQPFDLNVAQLLQTVTASTTNGQVLWTALRGREWSLAWQGAGVRWLLRGVVSADRWQGTLHTIAQWSNTTDDVIGRFDAMRLQS